MSVWNKFSATKPVPKYLNLSTQNKILSLKQDQYALDGEISNSCTCSLIFTLNST